MNDDANGIRGLRLKYILGTAITIFVFALGSLLIFSSLGVDHDLMPMLPSPTAPTHEPQKELETVAFTDLNDSPLAFLNRSIIVTGDYLPAETTDCVSIVGPDMRWSLTADNLQLDASGFERIVRLVSVGTTMTVQGTWRLYQGPIGCGKGPSRGSVWYLDVKKIIQPNPLISEGGQVIPVEIKNTTPELPSTFPTESGIEIAPTEIMMTATLSAVGTSEASPTNPVQSVSTDTQVPPVDITPSATVSLPPNIDDPTSTPESSGTTPTATRTVTATSTENPGSGTPTFTPESPLIPATSTETSGYPGPTASPPYP